MIEKTDVQTSQDLGLSSNKISVSTSPTKFLLGLILFLLVLALPSGITAWFDGLPWVGEIETVVLAILFPFLLILGWRFLSIRFSMMLLGALLVLKVILYVGSPASGLLVKVYPNSSKDLLAKLYKVEGYDSENWMRTYYSLWNDDVSGILQEPWMEMLDFPLDWVMFGGGCPPPWYCFDKLTPIIEIEGSILLPEGKRFAFVAQGVQEGKLSAVHESGESFVLTPAKTISEASEKQYQLPRSGSWRITGKLHYVGTEWSLVPVLISEDGKLSTELGREVLWQNEESLSNAIGQIGTYKVISFVSDVGIIAFLLIWSAWSCRILAQQQILNRTLAVGSVSAVCLSIFAAPVFENILKRLGSLDPTSASNLGFSFVIASMGFLIWVYWKKDFRNLNSNRISRSILLFFSPGLLVFFAIRWWPIIGQWVNWGVGDDWTSYQYFARKIVVEGEWLLAGEGSVSSTGVFIMQPFYRYFVGLYHWLFGQSPFVQHLVDVWCVLGATVLLASWGVKLRLSAINIFIASSVYLVIILIGSFRYHIGRGLIENHAMFFMFLAGWLLYGAREGNFMKIVGAGVCGTIGYWLRQDHLVVIAMLVFLIVEPTHGTVGEVWKSYWNQIWTYWRRGFSYVGIILFGLFLMCLRNWWVGGVFAPSVSDHVIREAFDLNSFYLKMKLMLTATYLPTPSIATIILLPGTLFGFLSFFFRPKFLREYPMAFGWALFGVFLPYVFFGNPGYAPRYSIHLLPLALLSVMIVFNNLIEKLSFFKPDTDKNLP